RYFRMSGSFFVSSTLCSHTIRPCSASGSAAFGAGCRHDGAVLGEMRANPTCGGVTTVPELDAEHPVTTTATTSQTKRRTSIYSNHGAMRQFLPGSLIITSRVHIFFIRAMYRTAQISTDRSQENIQGTCLESRLESRYWSPR